MTDLPLGLWERAGSWILDRWSRRQGWSPDHRCLLFVAADITRRRVEGEKDLAAALASLDSELLTPSGDLAGAAQKIDPYVFLMALGRLAARGCPRAPFAAYLRKIEEALTQVHARQRRGQVLLLSALLADVEGGESRLRQEKMPLLRPEEVFDAADEAIEELCYALAAGTGFGARPNLLDDGDRAHLAEALAAVAFSYLRDYRLDSACHVIRALLYLDPGSRAAEQAAAYLRLQQQSCGCFGFLSHAGKGLAASRKADVDAEIFLPTTFACLWTLFLAETGRDPVISGVGQGGGWQR